MFALSKFCACVREGRKSEIEGISGACVCLQFVTLVVAAISPLNSFTGIFPLAFVVGVTGKLCLRFRVMLSLFRFVDVCAAIKEAYEDYRRHQLDNAGA